MGGKVFDPEEVKYSSWQKMIRQIFFGNHCQGHFWMQNYLGGQGINLTVRFLPNLFPIHKFRLDE